MNFFIFVDEIEKATAHYAIIRLFSAVICGPISGSSMHGSPMHCLKKEEVAIHACPCIEEEPDSQKNNTKCSNHASKIFAHIKSELDIS